MRKLCTLLFACFVLVACMGFKPTEKNTLSFQDGSSYPFTEASLFRYDEEVKTHKIKDLSPKECQEVAQVLSSLKKVSSDYALASIPDEKSLLLEFTGPEGSAQLTLLEDPSFGPNQYSYSFKQGEKTFTYFASKDLMDPIRKITGTEITSSFPDCKGHWANKYIADVEEKSVMKGMEDGNFYPNQTLSRGMLVQALYTHSQWMGLEKNRIPLHFSDVGSDAWYKEALSWALAEDLIKGYPDGSFRGQDPISREELAFIFYQYTDLVGHLHQDKASKDYADKEKISPWAQKAVSTMRLEGVMDGKEGNFFDPQGPVTRAELARILSSI